MAKLVSKTYGEALFELAVEENTVDSIMEEVIALKQVLLDNPDFTTLMNHPKVIKDEKIKVVEHVFKSHLSDEFVGFLTLIVEKDRYSDLEDILDYLTNQIKVYKGIGVVHVATAIPLDEIQKKQIEERILKTTSYKNLEMHYEVEPKLIGGMTVQIGDRVVDSSVQTKLNELEKQLMKIQLANSQ